jgi:hypothetical protein
VNICYERLSPENRQLVEQAIYQCRKEGGRALAWRDALETTAEPTSDGDIAWQLRGWPSSHVIASGVLKAE